MSNSLRPHGLYSPWNSPGQNTGVASLSLLWGIFPTQGSNPGLPRCRWILYQLSHKGSPPQGHANQKQWDMVTSNLLEWLLSNGQVIISANEDAEKRKCLYTVDGNINWYSYYGSSIEIPPSSPRLKIELPNDPASPLVGICPKEMKSLYSNYYTPCSLQVYL